MSDRTIVNLLKNRTSQHPDRIAYPFLENGENKSASLTYRSLDTKARAIALMLRNVEPTVFSLFLRLLRLSPPELVKLMREWIEKD